MPIILIGLGILGGLWVLKKVTKFDSSKHVGISSMQNEEIQQVVSYALANETDFKTLNDLCNKLEPAGYTDLAIKVCKKSQYFKPILQQSFQAPTQGELITATGIGQPPIKPKTRILNI